MAHLSQPGPSDALFEAHWREVYALLLAITRKPALAEDLAQEVFVLAVRKDVQPGPAASGWFRAVARYLALNELRRKRPQAADPALLDLAAAAPGAAGDHGFEEELQALRACLLGLDANDRDVLRARYESSTPLEEIAQRNGQSPGYIKQRLLRLRRKLAHCVRARLLKEASADA